MTVPARRTQQERREGTIHKLLEAATETLIDVGYAQASVQTICDRAGVSQGALFRHFATREALMVAVGEHVGARILESYRKKFIKADKRDPKRDGDIEAALRLVRDACRSRLNQAWYELEVASRTSVALRKALAPVSKRYFANIIELARELLPDVANALGPTFDVLVTSVIALFDGETTHRFVHEDRAAEEARLVMLVKGIKLLTH